MLSELSDKQAADRILMVDSHDGQRRDLIEELSREHFRISTLEQPSEVVTRVIEDEYRLVLLNAFSISTEDMQAVQLLKENSLTRWIPILVLLRVFDPGARSRFLEAGAEDVITVHQDYTESKIRIRNLLHKAHEFELKAFRDLLTKAYNRGYFFDRIRVEIERAARIGKPLSLAFTDADRFKSVNDTFGHDVGDLVLQGLARMLQENIEPSDVLARFGGEEFVLLLPGADAGAAKKRVEAILECVHREPVARHDGQARFITFSGGVAEWQPGMTADELIKLADDAAYQAKRKGRDQVVLGRRPDTNVRRILLAEHDDLIEEMLSGFERMELQLVRNGEEAKTLLLEKDIDLCIFETGFPLLNAYEILEQIKTNPLYGHYPTKVMLISTKELRQFFNLRCAELGADDYKCKPVSKEDLEKSIRKLLGEVED